MPPSLLPRLGLDAGVHSLIRCVGVFKARLSQPGSLSIPIASLILLQPPLLSTKSSAPCGVKVVASTAPNQIRRKEISLPSEAPADLSILRSACSGLPPPPDAGRFGPDLLDRVGSDSIPPLKLLCVLLLRLLRDFVVSMLAGHSGLSHRVLILSIATESICLSFCIGGCLPAIAPISGKKSCFLLWHIAYRALQDRIPSFSFSNIEAMQPALCLVLNPLADPVGSAVTGQQDPTRILEVMPFLDNGFGSLLLVENSGSSPLPFGASSLAEEVDPSFELEALQSLTSPLLIKSRVIIRTGFGFKLALAISFLLSAYYAVYGTELWNLLGRDCSEAYFFSTRKRESAAGSKVDKKAGSGSWTIYNKEELVTSVVCITEMVAGRKSCLSFNDSRWRNLGWTMHEYELYCSTEEFQEHGADANGVFKEKVVKKSDDFVITNVSQVKPEIALLLYVNVKSSLKEDTFLGVMDQEEWLSMI
ncbi:hypothetical protein Cni_G03723 [Canna indica]|uniref:NAC domain-containing protein n=1 Tax=Canna indica TaxID=4628 RepID=A0AAQ3Q226_9LILI|nr:hypothetical protein Cni_G03723 [Canna indica]